MQKIFSSRRFLIAISIGALISVTIPQFITYDTGVRCITAPCDEAQTVASFLAWLLEGRPLIYDADYGVAVVGFFLYSGLIYWLYPKVIKSKDS